MGDNVIAKLSMVGLVAAVQGCLVGPDFERPKVELNAEWNGANDPRLAADKAVDQRWWKQFRDPTLDQLIEIAYKQNYDLQIAGLRILETRAELGIAFGALFPHEGGASASAEAVRTSGYAPNAQGVQQSFGQFQAGFDTVWELDFWGKYRRGVRSAEATYAATIADYDDALVTLTAEVARTYVLIRTNEALLVQARQNVALQEQGQEIADSRFRNGATSELDLAQATNLLETTRATIPRLEVSLKKSQNALNTLLGRPTGFAEAVLAAPRGIPEPPAVVQVSVPAELIRRRPDIRGAELRALAQCERIGMAEAELYPSFSLSGAIGTQTSVGSSNPSNSPLFGPGTLFANVGGSVFWPLFNYPRLLENIRVEDARFQQSLVAYVQTVIRAAQEVDDGIVGFTKNQDAAKFSQGAVDSAESAVKLALVQYREGAVDYQRVLDTQRVLLASQNTLIDTRAATATELISLYKALGGGWQIRLKDPFVNEKTQREMEDRTNWGSHFERLEEQRTEDADASKPSQRASRK
ncbi:MAG: efflux transporter outer membrane subunit [Polyangiaceae bacterium]|nr:efflux transporter outer membrane subunit [Polyangiaceae bacterium]